MTCVLPKLLAPARSRQLHAVVLYDAYATRVRADGDEPVALAEFLIHLLAFGEDLDIETAVVNGKPRLRGVKLVARQARKTGEGQAFGHD